MISQRLNVPIMRRCKSIHNMCYLRKCDSGKYLFYVPEMSNAKL